MKLLFREKRSDTGGRGAMLGKIVCFFGIHNWLYNYTNEPYLTRPNGDGVVVHYRIDCECKRCGKKESFGGDGHCL